GSDAHRAQVVEALAHPLLDSVLQIDHAEHLVVARNRQGRAALARDAFGDALQLGRRPAALLAREREDRVAGSLAQARAVVVDAAHTRLRGERDELRLMRRQLVLAQAVLL